ncbi:MAG: hypothetical protein ACI921_001139 [Polaribacter sp.]|jgi:hypothetical protein
MDVRMERQNITYKKTFDYVNFVKSIFIVLHLYYFGLNINNVA